MEYISVKEAAKRWNVSVRYVQKYCVEGRIPGARKIGNAWAVPRGATQPGDFRNPKVKADAQRTRTVSIPLAQTNAVFPLGEAEAFAEAQEHPLARAEYCYYAGSVREAVSLTEPYLDAEDLSVRLSACLIYALASLSLSKPENALKAKKIIEDAYNGMNGDTPRDQRAIIYFFVSAICTFLHVPRPPKMPELQFFINDLQDGVRFFAMMLQAYFAYLNELYGTAIGIVETMLVIEDIQYPIPSIYMHLICAMCFSYTKYPQRAAHHILSAWEIARQDGLFQPFAQLYPFLCGMLEVNIKKPHPEDFRRIIAMTKGTLPGWCTVHNALTENKIPTNLTPNEFTIAMLASRNLSNREISQYLSISESTVKSCISSVRSKLSLDQRKDLAGFMPR